MNSNNGFTLATGIKTTPIPTITTSMLQQPEWVKFWSSDSTNKEIQKTKDTLSATNSEYHTNGDTRWVDMRGARDAGPNTDLYNEVAQTLHSRALIALTQNTNSPNMDANTLPYAATRIVDELLGLGPIEPLMHDPQVTEIMINNPNRVFYETRGELVECPAARFNDDTHVGNVINHMLYRIGVELSPTTPTIDSQLPTGERINATHPTFSNYHTLTIRRFPNHSWTLADMIENNSMSPQLACSLADLVAARLTILIIGGTGSGKTSILNCLTGAITPTDRILTIEDSRELRPHPGLRNVVSLTTITSQGPFTGIDMTTATKNSLRMRPDRIIVGEIRDGTIGPVFDAFATGHEGSMCTLHANDPNEAAVRMRTLYSRAGTGSTISRSDITDSIGIAIDVIVHVSRVGTKRRIRQVVTLDHDLQKSDYTLHPLWSYDQKTDTHHQHPPVLTNSQTGRLNQIERPTTITDLHNIQTQARKLDEETLNAHRALNTKKTS